MPKKAVKQIVKEAVSDSESNNDYSNENMVQVQPMYLTTNSVKLSDSDRVQLAQAINNFTLKSEQLLQEMKNFDTFRENVFNLDLLIDSKKQEHAQTISSLELEYTSKKKNLEDQY